MNVQQLTQLVSRYFSEQASVYNLRADDVRVEYRLNWTGFVNASFCISDPLTSYHFKVTHTSRHKTLLKRWQRLHTTLENEYHAPRLVDWIDLPGGYSGLLLENIAGDAPDLVGSPVLFQEILTMVIRLHADQVLGMVLRGLDGPRTCLMSYLLTYQSRFREDLKSVEEHPPVWLADGQLAGIRREVRTLEELTRSSRAFQFPANSPVHGDLRPGNILRAHDSRWYVLDWDDLTIGDPALDWILLLSPLGQARAEFPVGFGWQELISRSDPGLEQRMEFYTRAYLLDLVLDGLADVVDAEETGENLARYQEQKKDTVLQAWEQYLRLYPSIH